MKKEDLKRTRQYKIAKVHNTYWNNVPRHWCVRFDMSPTELLIYCTIRDATENLKQRCFTGSVQMLCSYVNVSKPTVRKALDKLENAGFIRKVNMKREIRGEKTVKDGVWIGYEALPLRAGENTIEDMLDIHRMKREEFIRLRERNKV